MLIQELFDKSITNIYQITGIQQGWLDTSECFVEIDGHLIIDIPYSFQKEVNIKLLKEEAKTLFSDLSDYSIYHLYKNPKQKGDLIKLAKKRKNILSRIKHLFFAAEEEKKQHNLLEIELLENDLKYIQNQKIKDFIYFDDDEKGFLQLENGYIISETNMSPHGTGHAGLNIYKTIHDLIKSKNDKYLRLSGSLNK